MRRLQRDNAVLVMIDVQEKLVPVMQFRGSLLPNLDRLLRGSEILGVPVVVTEQYVKGLGPTIEPLRDALGERYRPIEKMCFSSAGCGEFTDALSRLGRKQILLCGIEAHVCVFQTAIDLLDSGHEVYLVVDAISSRTTLNWETATKRLEQEGAKLTSTEMALFELTVTSGTDEFKAISKLVK